ncbi:dTMP kinase [Candidatus Peregrinibacteria bacterium]|nr:dTMP kinase [Candidatus Peregrinibacteria bacterium]
MFIAFEGLDGSGSSTQSRLLAKKLEANGHAVLLTKEPTSDSPIGKMIREVLQHKWDCSPDGLQLLFSADRAEHLKNKIEPALKNGQIVITDRYFFSTIAYGALAVDDAEWLKQLSKHFRVPDITFLFRLDPKTCIERIQGRGSDFELFEQHDKLETIWRTYEKIAEEYPHFHLIDASKSIDEISDEIWKIVSGEL